MTPCLIMPWSRVKNTRFDNWRIFHGQLSLPLFFNAAAAASAPIAKWKPQKRSIAIHSICLKINTPLHFSPLFNFLKRRRGGAVLTLVTKNMTASSPRRPTVDFALELSAALVHFLWWWRKAWTFHHYFHVCPDLRIGSMGLGPSSGAIIMVMIQQQQQ